MNHSTPPTVSVVVPVYGSDTVLPELLERTAKTLEKLSLSFELIFVNDASPDNAWQVIKELAEKDGRVRGINLSRNFGQYPAITAGLSASRGEWVIVMDCDLQDQPEGIERMYPKTKEGYLVVLGSREKRHDSVLRRLVSWGFYSTLDYLSGRHHDRTLTNFGMYHRRVIDAILSLPDHMRFFSVMVRWVGFRAATVPVEHTARKGGKSGYSYGKLLSLATDILLAYSEQPLRLIIKIGVVVTFFSGAYLAIRAFGGFFGYPLRDFEALMGSLWFIFGLLSMMVGTIALYLGKVFEEVKKRPIYIIQEEV